MTAGISTRAGSAQAASQGRTDYKGRHPGQSRAGKSRPQFVFSSAWVTLRQLQLVAKHCVCWNWLDLAGEVTTCGFTHWWWETGTGGFMHNAR